MLVNLRFEHLYGATVTSLVLIGFLMTVTGDHAPEIGLIRMIGFVSGLMLCAALLKTANLMVVGVRPDGTPARLESAEFDLMANLLMLYAAFAAFGFAIGKVNVWAERALG